MRGTMHAALILGLCGAGAKAGPGAVIPGSPLVVDGRIERVDMGVTGDASDDASTVDTVRFTATTSGLHIIDLLSWEVVFDEHRHISIYDLNGDGLHNFFDTEIHLFRDDGDLGAEDLIESNGDSEFPHHGDDGHNHGGHQDGSVFEFDSFLRLRLDPGDYILKVGAFLLSVDDAIDGLNDTSPFNVGHYPLTWDPSVEALVPTEFGSYRATIRLVPAPGGAALLAAAAGAIARRRR